MRDGFLSAEVPVSSNGYREEAVSDSRTANTPCHHLIFDRCRAQTAILFLRNSSSSMSHKPRLESSCSPPLTAYRYHDHANALSVPADALYNALLADAERQPQNWNLQGRQIDTWKSLGYIPQDIFERGGANTRQVSRTVEVRSPDDRLEYSDLILGVVSTHSTTSRSLRSPRFSEESMTGRR